MKRFSFAAALLILVWSTRAWADTPWFVQTFAGGGPAGAATSAVLDEPSRVAVGPTGEIFAITRGGQRLVGIDPTGQIRLLADSQVNDRVDGIFFSTLNDVTVDPSGMVYVSESHGAIHRIDPVTGDNELLFGFAFGSNPIAVDAQGRVYFRYRLAGGDYISRLDPADGSFTNILGCETTSPCPLFSMDGQPADSITVELINGMTVDSSGNLFVVSGARVFRIDAATETVSVYAGTGSAAFSGDGGPATMAELGYFNVVSLDAAGNLFIADPENERIRRVDATTGFIDTIAGTGDPGFSGDGGSATAADLNFPEGVAVAPDGTIVIADSQNLRLRSIDGMTGTINTVAGNGEDEYDGSETLATHINLATNSGAIDTDGALLVAGRRRIYRIDPSTGLIRAIAGTGEFSFPAVWVDGVDAMNAEIAPASPAIGPEGDLYFASGGFIHRIDRVTNQVTRLPNSDANSITFDADGNLFAATGFTGINRYDLDSQQSIQLAGGGSTRPFDGIEALDARLDPTFTVTIGPDEELLISYNRSIQSLPAGDSRLFSYAGGASQQILQIDLGIGPISLHAIPSSRGLFVSFDDRRNGFTNAIFHDTIYRIDGLTGDAVRILGAPLDPSGRVEFEIEPAWVVPLDENRIYIGSRNKILLATNTSVPPDALIDAPVSAECSGPDGAVIHFDGSASSDPDDTPGSPSEINLFRWYEDYGQPTQSLLAKGEVMDIPLDIGVHDITLLVRDLWGRIGTTSVTTTIYGAGDPDGDGIDICSDNCATIANPGQEDGDQNGVGDVCDPCLGDPSGDGDADGVCTDADNCPRVPNPAQLDFDLDGTGDDCDVCPNARVVPSDGAGSCVAVPDVDETCVPVVVDSDNASARGQVVLEVFNEVAPERLQLDLLVFSNSVADRYMLLVNGEVIIDEPSPVFGPSCFPRFVRHEVAFDPTLNAAWKGGEANELRFIKTGTDSDVFRVFVALRRGTEAIFEEIYQITGVGGCTDGVTDVELDESASVDDIFSFDSIRLAEVYGPGTPRLDVAAEDLGAARYTLCVSSTDKDNPGQVFAVTRHGHLVQIDPFTAESTVIGALPILPDAFTFNPVSGRAFVGRSSALQEIDLRDGTARGGRVLFPSTVSALAARDGLFIVASNLGSTDLRSSLQFHEADGTPAGFIGSLDPGWTLELAYNPVTENLFGVRRSGSDHTGFLFQAPFDGTVEVIEPFAPGRGITIGPDNVLYRAGSFADTSLYRSGANGYEVVGDLGFDTVWALTTVGSKGHRDCTTFRLEDGQSLAINQSCGGPTAAIAPVSAVECDSAQGGTVLLDGSGSTDPNDPDGVLANHLTFAWYEDHGTNAQTLIGTGEVLGAVLSVGSHTITLEVTNRFGETALTAATAEIFDLDAPVLELSLNPTELWPPNHQMVDIEATVIASDNCGAPTIALASLASNEADDALGRADGKTTGDIQPGVDDFHFSLRAERAGTGGGRIYTVVYTATDGAGNVASEAGFVFVPHDQGGAIDPMAITLERSASGTVVSWAAVPNAENYDVIRGDLNNVVETGVVINVGTVVCIEADSMDESTVGQEDSAVPNPGQAFFYLAQYYDGISSTYGAESPGKPRAPGLGDCP